MYRPTELLLNNTTITHIEIEIMTDTTTSKEFAMTVSPYAYAIGLSVTVM